MLDALGEWMSQPYYYSYGADPCRAHGPRHASISPYGPYDRGGGARCSSASRTSASGRCCATRSSAARTWSPTSGSRPTRRVAHDAELREIIEASLAALVEIRG